MPPLTRKPALLAALAVVLGIAACAAFGWRASLPARPARHAASSALDRLPPLPDKPAKNVIVMIGDGMGFNHVAASDLYRNGGRSGGVYDELPVRLAMSTYLAGGSYDPVAAWSDFAYVRKDPTDSAAGGTALATGHKTTLGRIGEGPKGERLRNAVEAAEAAGKATGVVTSVPFAHATPASFTAHDSSRRDIREIAHEILTATGLEVVIGTGHPYYDDGGRKVTQFGPRSFDYVGGQDTWKQLIAGRVGGERPFAFFETRAQVQALARGETPERIVVVPQVFMTLQERRPGNRQAEPYAIPLTKSVPTLAEETKAALNVLDEDPDGMLLMIEGGAIDWASHANESGRLIEEQEQFDEAVQAVIDWVDSNSDWSETLLVVTADHETGQLTGPGAGPGDDDAAPKWPEPIAGREALDAPSLSWHAKTHTNSLVPLWAHGAHARLLLKKPDGTDPVRGRYVDNTTVGRTIFRAMHAWED